MTKRKQISILGWALIIAINFVLISGLAEIILRIIPPDPQSLTNIVTQTDDFRPFVLKPNSQSAFHGFSDPLSDPILWQINEDGIRSDQPIKNKSNRFRILTYGDSETFGWSVNLENTWQRHMEKIDENIEVINLGIPGYNVKNVADHMKHTAPDLKPDLIIYLFHKNDFYESFSITPVLSKSELYIHLRMAFYVLNSKKRHAWRKSSEGQKFVSSNIKRMLSIAEELDVPIIFAFRHWKYHDFINNKYWDMNELEKARALPRSLNFSAEVVNIEPVVDNFPRRDAHLTEPAQIALANYLCEYLSGNDSNGCTWSGANTIKP